MPEAFREGHNRLYRHFRRSQPNLPDSTLLMGPLYLAVGHGCAAAPAGAGEKLLNDVLETVYWPRIKRGDDGFNTRKLGAFVADLAVLDGFFERRWDRLRGDVPVSSRARLLYEAGFDLRALGRLGESLGPMRSSLAERVRRREWTEAAKTAGDLTLLYATLGQFDRALRTAGYCVRHAEKSRCPFERSRARSNLVHALLQAGEPERAAAAFREAERLVREDAERQGPLPPAAKRPTLQSYWFYELHLDLKDYAKVDELASPSPTGATPTGTPLLDRALAGVALAWSWMGRAAGGDPRAADLLDEARKRLDDALVAVKLAGTNHHLPRVLLASAALHRLRGEWREAELNLKEAAEVSARGEMEAHRADVFLEYARLHLARGLKETARRHLTDARNAVYQMGYRRRVAEVERLERELGQFADGLGIPSPSGS
jgi:tetratricopeptide (TPR) repeat protein